MGDVDEHRGKFDWVLISKDLSFNYTCVLMVVWKRRNKHVEKENVCVLDRVL